jgi:hypothetical protein
MITEFSLFVRTQIRAHKSADTKWRMPEAGVTGEHKKSHGMVELTTGCLYTARSLAER